MKTPTNRFVPVDRSKNPIDPRVDIGYVHMKTADLQRVYDFYIGILGFDRVHRMPSALFLSVGGYHHDLAFNTWESHNGPAPAQGTTGLYHVAIRHPDRASLGDALHRLIEAKRPLDGVNDHGTHETLSLRDPDGNGLELYWDRPEKEWPIDEQGHLRFDGGRLDIEGLLKAG